MVVIGCIGVFGVLVGIGCVNDGFQFAYVGSMGYEGSFLEYRVVFF